MPRMQTILPLPQMIAIDALPSLPLRQRDALPEEAAIYFVLQHGTLRYIGQTKYLNKRWRHHHRLQQYTQEETTMIAWLAVPQTLSLVAIERVFIDYFAPTDNLVRMHRRDSVPKPLLRQSKASSPSLIKSVDPLAKPNNRYGLPVASTINLLRGRFHRCRCHREERDYQAIATEMGLTKSTLYRFAKGGSAQEEVLTKIEQWCDKEEARHA